MKNKPKVSLNPATTPILYTDNISITSNKNGVILNIMQGAGQANRMVVARIGMSREHAKTFAQKMGELILMTERKTRSLKNRAN